ncbi:MAG: hypothetical protein ACRDJW_15020 [Thermomicrobiales bacterium]
MAVSVTRSQRTPALERLLERHRLEAEQLRRELGDPQEALAAFVREHYDQELLAAAFQDLIGGNVWDADDLIDEGKSRRSLSAR